MKLDPLLSELFQTQDLSVGGFNPNDVKRLKQARYRKLMRGINIFSYSTFGSLDACDRKFSIKKLELSRAITIPIVTQEYNINFAYGKCFETGIQSTLFGKNQRDIWWDMFHAWDMPLDAFDERSKKSFMDCCIAIDKFQFFKNTLFGDWEMAYFNGKPAIELAMCIDLNTGDYYVGHADIILYNPTTGRYRVLEIKTTGRNYIHEAMYKNSDQGTGYSVILDSIVKDLEKTSTFEVFYLVYMTGKEEWKVYEFTKSRSQRAGWLNTILLDIQKVKMYQRVGFFPKRGTACFDYYKPCEYLDTCDLAASSWNGTGEFDTVTVDELAEHQFDFRFNLNDIIQAQEELI